MPQDIQLHPDSKGDMAKRIADRLRPSNDLATADVHAQHGTSPQRVHHTIHHSAGTKKHGPGKSAEGPTKKGQL